MSNATSIATFNIENFYTNKLYLNTLLKKHHIVALQEHWLYHFEQQELKKFCDERNFNVAVKSVDECDPILPHCRPRGMGGVAVLWNKEIDSMVTVVPDGGVRIQALLVQTKVGDICLINTYMPCRGKTNSDVDYSDNLDQISEIIHKYSSSAYIILLGDMNASLLKDAPNTRDKLLMDFCNSHQLFLGESYPNGNTYHHSSGNSKSQIDYILTRGDFTGCPISDVEIKTREALNTSTHDPVVCMMPEVTSQVVSGESAVAVKKKIRWEKLNREGYQGQLHEVLMKVDFDKTSLCDMGLSMERFCEAMVKAAEDSAPSIKPGKKKRLWSRELHMAAVTSKDVHFQWKNAGQPGPEHPLSIQRKAVKRQLRTAQRQQQAEYRAETYRNIMEADSSNKRLFFSLINRQRKEGRQSLSQLFVDDRHLTTEETIREGWATYFEKLATPKDDPLYDQGFKNQVELDFNLICDICSRTQDSVQEISCETVEKIIKSLKNNKASDGSGITAEHLKYGGHPVTVFITKVLNSIILMGKVPEMFKMGFITPIYKKQGKPVQDPNSYRRITITNLIGKVLEKYLLQTAFAKLEAQQNPLQKGFTKGTSATVAALLFTEAISDSRDCKTPLYAACIDASKAFDVVWHKSLLRKLYNMGLTGTPWNILQDSYKDMSSVVNWCGKYSRSF
ncbi:MAG: endonuclease/exonuclease/phosphatase family protein, partial [Candidatus Thiodiazotropha sp.]